MRPVEDCNTRAVVHRRLGGSQSQNGCSPLAHEDNEVDHNQGAIQLDVADSESVVTVLEDGFDEDFAEEVEVISEGGVDVLSEIEFEVEVPFRLSGTDREGDSQFWMAKVVASSLLNMLDRHGGHGKTIT